MSIISVVQHAASSVSLSLSFVLPFSHLHLTTKCFHPALLMEGERERRQAGGRGRGARPQEGEETSGGEDCDHAGGSSGEHVRLARMGEQCKQRMDGWMDGGTEGWHVRVTPPLLCAVSGGVGGSCLVLLRVSPELRGMSSFQALGGACHLPNQYLLPQLKAPIPPPPATASARARRAILKCVPVFLLQIAPG